MPEPVKSFDAPRADIAAIARKAVIMRRIKSAFMVAVSLVLAGVGVVAIGKGNAWVGWSLLVFFGLAAVAYARMLLIECNVIRPRPGEAGRPFHTVTITDEAILCTDPRGGAESVSWDGLEQVILRAEDAYPVGDIAWVLIGADGTACVVPTDAEGSDALLEEMQRRLPGFDNKAVIAAMGMLDGTQVAWRRSEE